MSILPPNTRILTASEDLRAHGVTIFGDQLVNLTGFLFGAMYHADAVDRILTTEHTIIELCGPMGRVIA